MLRQFAIAVGTLALSLGAQHATVQAATVVGGSSLLTSPYLAQLESWVIDDPTLGYDGELVLTNVFTKGVTGWTAEQFHTAVNGLGPTIFLAQATTYIGTVLSSGVVGGFNAQSWANAGNMGPNNITAAQQDRTAFIFNLTSGDRRDQTSAVQGDFQTVNRPDYGPTFGGGHDVYVDMALTSGYLYSFSYCPAAMLASGCVGIPDLLGKTELSGFDVQYGALEVFTLSTVPLAAVPVPAALPMLAAGVGALGLIGWRKRKATA